ncbi:MAG: hypothetical protein J3T61_09475 [Candidatus Brocadiales bacterium]|nr:hypothetical protein [Candidatus Bathyanammoxibius sp.]
MKFSIIMGCLLGILALGVVSTDYSGTALAQESIKAVCPNCAEKDMHMKGMGVIPHEKTMSCPDCKGKSAGHVCEKRSAEKLTCPMHKKVAASVERETTEAVCPTCKEKIVLKKGIGITPLKREMVCIDCKGKGAEHVCKKCDAEALACPRCSKA